MATHPSRFLSQLTQSYASAPSVVFMACAKRNMHAFLSQHYRSRSNYSMKTIHFAGGGIVGAMIAHGHPVLMTLGLGVCVFHKSIDRALRQGPQQP